MLLSPSSSDAGDVIRQLLKRTLYNTMGLDFDNMMQRFIFFTDCVAVMSTVVVSFTSTIRVDWDGSWSPCVVHKLNTVMKDVVLKVENLGYGQCIKMFYDWRCLKKVVGCMKKTRRNEEMPQDLALDQ